MAIVLDICVSKDMHMSAYMSINSCVYNLFYKKSTHVQSDEDILLDMIWGTWLQGLLVIIV
jgi:hypothetical protein